MNGWGSDAVAMTVSFDRVWTVVLRRICRNEGLRDGCRSIVGLAGTTNKFGLFCILMVMLFYIEMPCRNAIHHVIISVRIDPVMPSPSSSKDRYNPYCFSSYHFSPPHASFQLSTSLLTYILFSFHLSTPLVLSNSHIRLSLLHIYRQDGAQYLQWLAKGH